MITMKKTIVLVLLASLFLCFGEKAHAQIAYQEQLQYSFGGVSKDADGTKLSKEDLKNYFDAYQYSDYLNAARKFKSGAIVSGVGAGCVAAGYLGFASLMNKMDSDEDLEAVGGLIAYSGLGAVLIYGGLACVLTGIPIMLVQNHKLMDIAKDYNREQNVSLSVGMQQYGYVIALTF